MTPGASLLLPISVLWPLVLALACLLPGLGPRIIASLWLAPIPALAAAVLAPRDRVFGMPGVLLDSGLALSETGALFLGGAATLWFWAGVYAARYMRGDPRCAAFALFWNLVLAGNLGVFLAADLISFYVFFALVSLMAYPLVIHDRKTASLRAGTVYIVLAVLGETALLAAFMIGSNGAGGAILISEIRDGLASSEVNPAVLWLLIVGFGIKAGLMPLHVWLPVAHPAAPVPASAVLSGAIVKAGIFGLVVFLPWSASFPVTGTALALLGFTGLFVAALLGVAQSNAKTVLAYSTVSQMGLVIGTMGAALAAGLPAGAVLPAVALYALHHGLAKGALFLSVGVAAKSRGAWRWVLMAVLAALALSMAGLPLSAGALAKSAIKDPAGAFGAMLIEISSLTSGLLLARFLFILPGAAPGTRPSALMFVSTLALAALAFAVPWIHYSEVFGTPAYAGDGPVPMIIGAWPLGLAAILAAAAVAIGIRAPIVPEGDLLELLRRGMTRVIFALRAMAGSRSQQVEDSQVASMDAWADNMKKIEHVVNDQAAIAIAMVVVTIAVLAALA